MRRPALAFLRRRNAERHMGCVPLEALTIVSQRNRCLFTDVGNRSCDASCATSLLIRGTIRLDRKRRRLAEKTLGINGGPTDLTPSQCCSISLSVLPDSAKITATQSPIIPAGMIAGASFSGPPLLVSVMKRRLRTQNARVLPMAVAR